MPKSETQMMCLVPRIDLPDELMDANSTYSDPDDPTGPGVSSIRNRNVSLTLYLGFVMDKFTSLRNFSKTKPHLRLGLIPFHFECDQTPVTFDPAVSPLIKIKVILIIFISPANGRQVNKQNGNEKTEKNEERGGGRIETYCCTL